MGKKLFEGGLPFFRFGSVWYRHKQAPALHLSAACQQFVPSLGLGISWVFELQPAGCVVLVNAEFSLRHNPLKVTGANFREKGLPVLHHVLRIKQPWALRGPDESRESLLSLDKGHLPLVLAINPQKVFSAFLKLPVFARED